MRTAPGRPSVVLVAREGDPATAVAVAATTAGIDGDGAEPASALAGVVEARLAARGIDARVVPGWDGLRATTLATTDAEATRAAELLRDVLLARVDEKDVAAAKKKLTALADRPLADAALERWARCVGDPHVPPARAGKPAEVDAAKLERWRSGALGLGRVTLAVAGRAATADAVARAVRGGAAWPAASAIPAAADAGDAAQTYELGSEPVVHVAIDVGSSSAAVNAAEALGDPHGPLAERLSELDIPFRIRSVAGAAHARGGCVGVVLEAQRSSEDLAARVGDAVALVHLEASANDATRDGRVLSRRTGDARDAAERAAWWALADTRPGTPRTAVALALPSRQRAAKEPRDVGLPAALAQARAAWEKPVVELRARTELGQGEAWVLLASPCGTEGETDADAGLSALVATTTAESAASAPGGDVHVEPWIASDGVGLLVHGAPRDGERPAAHARRLADVAARSFAAEPLGGAALTRARSDLLRRNSAPLGAVADALSPQHPSWFLPLGHADPLARIADGAVVLRAQALRAGPLRLAVLANADASQGDAAVRAADRWVPRRAGDARTCRTPAARTAPKPGTYAVPLRPGAVPEAYLAFPLPAGDDAAMQAGALVVAALEDGLLEKALAGLAHASSARIVGAPRAPALVVRVTAPQASLDDAVMQARGLLDRLRAGGLPSHERAVAAGARAALVASLDPRTRIVATWRGEPARTAPAAADVTRFLQRHVTEESMIVVAARPPRTP